MARNIDNALCPKCQMRYWRKEGKSDGYMDITLCFHCVKIVRKNPHDEREHFKRRYRKRAPAEDGLSLAHPGDTSLPRDT